MSIRPIGYRVLVKPDKLESDKTFASAKKAGIAIPENLESVQLAERKLDAGEVVAIGEAAFRVFKAEAGIPQSTPNWVNVGDRVVFAQYAGKTIIDPQDGERYLVLSDEDLVAVIKAE